LKKTKNLPHRFWWLLVAFLMLLCLAPGCGRIDLQFSSEYQAVFLDNGQVFFGKLSGTSSPFLTLRDVYYVKTVVEKDKKRAAHVLIKRGSEWHNPDFMRINIRHVVVIEPVGANSRVAQLIREAKSAPAPEAESPPPVPAPAPPAKPPATPAPKPHRR
jgi:hypothetical protein